jgi:RimJ/RimL family protein N-acetyltransferase
MPRRPASALRAAPVDLGALRVALLGPADARALAEHVARHAAESGRGGDLVFRPRSSAEEVDVPAAIARHRAAWACSITTPLWLRTWGLVEEGPDEARSTIYGHLDLTGGRLPAELHRATLGMGIERAARGRGLGRALIQAAIAWARAHGLAWIDLGVFAHNAPARALYASMGFVQTGAVRDQFRVDGVTIDDISMSLALA